MRAEMTLVMNELRRLAREQDWRVMTADLDVMAETVEENRAVVVAAAESDPSAFVEWAAARGEKPRIDAAKFQNIDVKARTAPHLIAFFTADHLIEATEVESVAQNFFTRPEGSYTVVIDVSNLRSEDDVRVVERSAWRLLVNDPPPNWTQAELRLHGVYFWSAGDVMEFLRERVAADGQKLAEWMRGPGGSGKELEVREFAAMMDQGEEIFRQQRGKRLTGNAVRVRELAKVMDEIGEFRRRLNRRLDSDADLLAGEVTGAMRNWSIPLRESIQSSLMDAFRGNRTITVEQAHTIVEGKLREASLVWAKGIEELIHGQREELSRNSRELTEFVNWELVNEVARDSGGTANYPDEMLAKAIASGDRFESRVKGGAAVGVPQPKESPFTRNLILLGLPVSLGVGAAATWIMRFPVGIPIGLLAGYLSTVAATQNRNAGCDIEQCRMFAADAVKHFLNKAIAHFQSETRMVATRFKQRVDDEVRTVHGFLEQALQVSYGSAENAADRELERRLAELRQQLETLQTSK